MADELTPEQQKLLDDQREEAGYSKFKAWLDRYAEENKPAPPKTGRGDGDNPGGFSLFGSLFGGGK